MTGTYIEAKFKPVCVEKIYAVANRAAALLQCTPIEKEQIHCTVLYSEIPKEPRKGEFKVNWKVSTKKYDLFGPEKDCLVILLNCPELVRLNSMCMSAGATSTYAQYCPHITLAYGTDAELFNYHSKQLNKMLESLSCLTIDSIHVKPLVRDWKITVESKYMDKDLCWKNYTMVGLKKDKKGNLVPNCVPKEDVKEKIESRLLRVSL